MTKKKTIVESVFKHEHVPISTSMFNDDGDLRPAKSKVHLKRTQSKASTHIMNEPELEILMDQ